MFWRCNDERDFKEINKKEWIVLASICYLFDKVSQQKENTQIALNELSVCIQAIHSVLGGIH